MMLGFPCKWFVKRCRIIDASAALTDDSIRPSPSLTPPRSPMPPLAGIVRHCLFAAASSNSSAAFADIFAVSFDDSTCEDREASSLRSTVASFGNGSAAFRSPKVKMMQLTGNLEIEEKRGVTSTEYGTLNREPLLLYQMMSVLIHIKNRVDPSRSRLGRSLVNGMKIGGSYKPAECHSSNRPASNSTSMQSNSVSSIPSQTFMPASSRQTTSISSVDVECPPPPPPLNSSVFFFSQSLTVTDKLKENSSGPSDRTFDDIDPLANWPSKKSNGSSMYKPNNNCSQLLSGPNAHFSSNNNLYGTAKSNQYNAFASGNANDLLAV